MNAVTMPGCAPPMMVGIGPATANEFIVHPRVLGPDGLPLPKLPKHRKQLRPIWPRRANGAIGCVTVRFGDGQYIPPELWKAWKPPAGWRKSQFYLRSNKDIETGKSLLVFPYARLYCYDLDKASGDDLSTINATLKVMQRPYP